MNRTCLFTTPLADFSQSTLAHCQSSPLPKCDRFFFNHYFPVTASHLYAVVGRQALHTFDRSTRRWISSDGNRGYGLLEKDAAD
jgi:hypothetical protein